jgi:predicted amidohydrolase
MRIACLQMIARTGDVAANLALLAEAAEEAAEGGARLLVAPELALTGYGAGDAFTALAEPADGPQVEALAALTARTGLAIVCGFAERAGDAVFNAAVLVDRGATLATYRKCQLYGDYERRHFAPGPRRPEVATVDGLGVGMLICFDVEFPEMARHLARSGADLLAVPTAVPLSPYSAMTTGKVVPVRAFENQVAIAYADLAGADPPFTYAGRSCIILPDGTEAARADATSPALLMADYDPTAFAESRRINPYLSDLRTDLGW